MEKVSDFIARRLSELGIAQVFMVTGGGAMHLNDSFSHQKGVDVVYCHHEQGCAIAAEGYYRASGKVACVNVTTGPGGLNALNGVLGQWTDSIPVVYVSGQVKFETTIGSRPELALRQLGDQEVDIVSIVKPIVKYAVQVRDPSRIRYEIDKAFSIAISGRMGPVWLDIPMNVQGAITDETALIGYTHDSATMTLNAPSAVAATIDRLRNAKRPLVVLGHGIRLAGAISEMETFIARLGAPVVTTFNGFDLVHEQHPLFVGRIGTLGSRSGNFALQNADVVLMIGTRNNIRQVSYDWANFAHQATRIVVDIDEAELQKPFVKPSIAVRMDAKDFLDESLQLLSDGPSIKDNSGWLAWCKERKGKYPVVLPSYSDDSTGINPYFFFRDFTKSLPVGSVSVAGNGTACVCLFQAGEVNVGTRYFWNSGCASMGYDLPAALGAAVACHKSVFCFAGDGSLQMNIQELQTLVTNHIPVKLLYLNNGGYVSIKQTQDNFFHRRAGCDSGSGVETPSMEKVAAAYGIPYFAVRRNADCGSIAARLESVTGPAIAEVFFASEYAFMPKTSSEKLPDGRMVSKPLEDLYPFLDRDEFESNMIHD
jgi:acetolactate synthase-1/2/3 large subunit